MNTETITIELLKRWRRGDSRATDRIYYTIKAKFFGVARRILHDEADSQAAFDDSFVKLQGRVRDGFEWEGEARFYAYFKRILMSICIDYYHAGKLRREWIDEHLLSTKKEFGDEGVLIERVEEVADYGWDPSSVDVESQRRQEFQREIASYLEKKLTPTGWRFWRAYYELVHTPGSDNWGAHEKTAFLKRSLGISDTTFYPAHSRFKQVLKPFLGEERRE